MPSVYVGAKKFWDIPGKKSRLIHMSIRGPVTDEINKDLKLAKKHLK